MPHSRTQPVILTRLILAAISLSAAPCLAVDYSRDIRPLLSAKCFLCHGPDEMSREADLRLDLADDATMDRGGYAAIVPGDPAGSEILLRIEDPDPDMKIPPASSGKTLALHEI